MNIHAPASPPHLYTIQGRRGIHVSISHLTLPPDDHCPCTAFDDLALFSTHDDTQANVVSRFRGDFDLEYHLLSCVGGCGGFSNPSARGPG